MSDEDCDAVAEFIRSRGITRCPTACVLPRPRDGREYLDPLGPIGRTTKLLASILYPLNFRSYCHGSRTKTQSCAPAMQ
jgi:hypothetical protein